MSFMQAQSIAPEGEMTPLHKAFYANVPDVAEVSHEVLESLWKSEEGT
jgi:hypothetical protein